MRKGTTDYPQLLNFGWLWWHYWILEMPLSSIGKRIGCSTQTVLNWFRYHSIATRTYSESETGHLNYFYSNGDKLKGENNPFFGKQHTEETKEKIRTNQPDMSGENNHFFGKHLSEGHKQKIRDGQAEFYKKHPEKREEITKHVKEFYKNHPEKAIEATERLMKQVVPSHHTKPELAFMDICKRNNIDFHFVGDKSLWIGDKVKLNPDFIEANGQKILVEIMGDYWHSPLLNPKVDKIRTLPYRKKHFKKYGWIPIFIWGSDMRRSDAEHFVLKTLSEHIKVR